MRVAKNFALQTTVHSKTMKSLGGLINIKTAVRAAVTALSIDKKSSKYLNLNFNLDNFKGKSKRKAMLICVMKKTFVNYSKLANANKHLK